MQDLDPTDYEIIVVDDAACETTRRQVDDWIECMHRGKCEDGPVHTIRYIAVTGSHGPAIARNVGWRAARGEIIAFIDDDCIPTPGWLSAGLAAFTDGIVGASGKLIMPLVHIPTDYEHDAVQLEKSEFVTANCFYRRDMLERVGGFDERFIAAWREDSDLFFTLQEYVEKCRGVQDQDGGRPQGSPLHVPTTPAPTDDVPQDDGLRDRDDGRPQGSPLHIHILSRPYNDHVAAPQGARSHCKGRGSGGGRWGPLWLPWRGTYASTPRKNVSGRGGGETVWHVGPHPRARSIGPPYTLT